MKPSCVTLHTSMKCSGYFKYNSIAVDKSLPNILSLLQWSHPHDIPMSRLSLQWILVGKNYFNFMIGCEYSGLCLSLRVKVFLIYKFWFHINHYNNGAISTIYKKIVSSWTLLLRYRYSYTQIKWDSNDCCWLLPIWP